jgi:hypothetical protein
MACQTGKRPVLGGLDGSFALAMAVAVLGWCCTVVVSQDARKMGSEMAELWKLTTNPHIYFNTKLVAGIL